VKKEFSYQHDRSVATELLVYAALIVGIVFGSCLFAEKLGISSMITTAMITIVALGIVTFYLLPIFKREDHPPVVADPLAGSVTKNEVTVSRDDVKEVYSISYTLGKQKWQVFRINGKKSIGIDTRNYPEADRFENMLSKIYPSVKIKKIQARSPFLLFSYVGAGYLVILWIIGMVI
jgi:hypothetical protein